MPTHGAKPADAVDVSSVDDSDDSFLREAAAIPDLMTGEEAAAPGLSSGELLAERFRIDRLAGRGGMGSVYCARDLVSGGLAAIKVMVRPRSAHADRFATSSSAREATPSISKNSFAARSRGQRAICPRACSPWSSHGWPGWSTSPARSCARRVSSGTASGWRRCGRSFRTPTNGPSLSSRGR
jgi:hypothetical protein